MRKRTTAYLFIAPLVAGYSVFYLLPFFRMLRFSFGGNGFSMDYYLQIFGTRSFMLALSNTAKFFAAALPLILILAYLLALLIRETFRKSKLLKSVFLLPYTMPVVGMVLLVDVVFGDAGLLSGLQSRLGVSFLEGDSAFWIAILIYLWKNTGYAVILLLAGLVAIPEEQYQAARLDGAGRFQEFLYITSPQMWYSAFFAVVFSLINGFRSFREIFLIGGEEPPDSIYMFQHFLNKCFQSMSYDKLSTGSILLLLVLLVFLGAFYFLVRRKEEFRG